MEKPFVFDNPTYVIRTSEVGGIPTVGDPNFRWPKHGPVSDPNWDPKPECGNGLHAVRMKQLHRGKDHLRRAIQPIFQICEVEANELIDLGGEKVKFPRCNVVFTGTWQGMCRKLRELGVPDRPTASIFRKEMDWQKFDRPSFLARLDQFQSELQVFFDKLGDERLSAVMALPNKPRMNDHEVEIYALVMNLVPSNVRLAMWGRLQQNTDNLFRVHPKIEKLMVATALGKYGDNAGPKNYRDWLVSAFGPLAPHDVRWAMHQLCDRFGAHGFLR